MANYQEARVKLTNTQLNKLKSAAKNKNGTIFWNIFKMKTRIGKIFKMKNCHMNYFSQQDKQLK